LQSPSSTPLASSTTPLASSSAAPTLPSNYKSPVSKAVMAGAILGALIGSILFSFGCFFLYKWSGNKKEQIDTSLFPTFG
jgi:hypothetical protein